jgi:hypothetical protein
MRTAMVAATSNSYSLSFATATATKKPLAMSIVVGELRPWRWACGVRYARFRYPMASTTSEVI